MFDAQSLVEEGEVSPNLVPPIERSTLEMCEMRWVLDVDSDRSS